MFKWPRSHIKKKKYFYLNPNIQNSISSTHNPYMKLRRCFAFFFFPPCPQNPVRIHLLLQRISRPYGLVAAEMGAQGYTELSRVAILNLSGESALWIVRSLHPTHKLGGSQVEIVGRIRRNWSSSPGANQVILNKWNLLEVWSPELAQAVKECSTVPGAQASCFAKSNDGSSHLQHLLLSRH